MKNISEKSKKPWPTKEAMEQIYAINLWGGEKEEFYSGEGSHAPKIVEPYLETLIKMLTSFDPFLTVCDLGCGDFNVGKELFQYSKNFIAVDIVPDLIEHNKVKFKSDNLEFQCLDIANDDLPSGECAILRQVLQHLSNAEIMKIVSKLKNYKYIVLTEHLPFGPFQPNVDIISGQGIRLKKKSGVDLLAEPFNLQIKETRELLRINLDKSKGILLTTLFIMS